MLRSRLVLWLSVFIFPPLALVLLWMRGDLGVLRRIAGTLAICVVAIVELFYVYGMHILWDGNVKPYGVSFSSRSRHDALVEAKQQGCTATSDCADESIDGGPFETSRLPISAKKKKEKFLYVQLRKWFWKDHSGLFCVVNAVFNGLPSPHL